MKPLSAFQRTLLLVTLASLAMVPAISQTNFGEINGTVTDPSGTQVPGAKIVLKSLETSAERQTASNNTGTYVIPRSLRAGTLSPSRPPAFRPTRFPNFRCNPPKPARWTPR